MRRPPSHRRGLPLLLLFLPLTAVGCPSSSSSSLTLPSPRSPVMGRHLHVLPRCAALPLTAVGRPFSSSSRTPPPSLAPSPPRSPRCAALHLAAPLPHLSCVASPCLQAIGLPPCHRATAEPRAKSVPGWPEHGPKCHVVLCHPLGLKSRHGTARRFVSGRHSPKHHRVGQGLGSGQSSVHWATRFWPSPSFRTNPNAYMQLRPWIRLRFSLPTAGDGFLHPLPWILFPQPPLHPQVDFGTIKAPRP